MREWFRLRASESVQIVIFVLLPGSRPIACLSSACLTAFDLFCTAQAWCSTTACITRTCSFSSCLCGLYNHQAELMLPVITDANKPSWELTFKLPRFERQKRNILETTFHPISREQALEHDHRTLLNSKVTLAFWSSDLPCLWGSWYLLFTCPPFLLLWFLSVQWGFHDPKATEPWATTWLEAIWNKQALCVCVCVWIPFCSLKLCA